METWRFPEIGVALNHPNLRWCFPLWPIHYGGTSMYGTPHMTFQLPSIPLLSLLTVWSSLPSLPAAAHGTHVLAPWTAHGGAETQDGKAEREAIYFLLSILFEPIRRKIEGLTVWEHDVAIMGSLEPHTWHINPQTKCRTASSLPLYLWHGFFKNCCLTHTHVLSTHSGFSENKVPRTIHWLIIILPISKFRGVPFLRHKQCSIPLSHPLIRTG